MPTKLETQPTGHAIAAAASKHRSKRKARHVPPEKIATVSDLKRRTRNVAVQASPGGRRVAEDKVRTLNVDGTVAQAIYLAAALAAIARHGTLGVHTLGKALFASRSPAASHGAAKRVLAGALKQGLVEGKRRAGHQAIYYALTPAGAKWVNFHEPGRHAATSGLGLLSGGMVKALHREWCATIVTAAEKRDGLVSFSELEIQREPADVTPSLLNERFAGNHLPDVLTFDEHSGKVVWHEVELSRRNAWSTATHARMQRAENKKVKQGETAKRARSGREQLVALLRHLRIARVLVRGGREYELVFVAHCASELILTECSRLIVEAYRDTGISTYPAKLEVLDQGRHYRVNFAVSTSQQMDIWLQLLPAPEPTKAGIFDTELLWPDAPHDVRPDNLSERFLAS